MFWLILVGVLGADADLATYTNNRDEYSVSYSQAVLHAPSRAELGDGRVFRSKIDSAMFVIYVEKMDQGYDDNPERIAALAKERIAALAKERCRGDSSSYPAVEQNIVTISCVIGSEIYYRKTIIGDGFYTTLEGTYPMISRETWDRVVIDMSRSLRGAKALSLEAALPSDPKLTPKH
jgi:hypothetical protein